MSNLSKVSIGVDVSKDYLDIYFDPTGKSLKIPNNVKGIKKLTKKLSKLDVNQVVCESSGGYERLMSRSLQNKGYMVWNIDPKRIKAFKDSKGIRVKTDQYDAKYIAMFAAQEKCEYPTRFYSDDEISLRDLTHHRLDLVSIITNEKKRIKQTSDIFCQQSITKHVEFLEKEVEFVDNKRKDIVQLIPEMSSKIKILTSMKGVGDTTAISLIALMPELGTLNDKTSAALLGVAPYTNQSGKFIGKSFISGGRSAARKTLFMAALTASRANPQLAKTYKRLRDNNKQPKVALVAVMRKMIIILNAMVKKEELWCYNI